MSAVAGQGSKEDTNSNLEGNKFEENTHVQVKQVPRGSCVWWSRRTSFERLLLCLSLLLLSFSAVLVIISIIRESKLRIVERIASRTCHSKECIMAASRMLEKMNPSVAPCEDFYEFACGNFLSSNSVPDDHHIRSTIQTMQETLFVTLKKLIEDPMSSNDSQSITKAKRLYSSCMNISSVEGSSVKVLRDLLSPNGVGEWPTLENSWNKTVIDLEWRLAMLHLHQVQPFFHFWVAPDDRNSSVYLLHFYSGSPILNPQYYLNTTDPDYVRYVLSYKNLLAETARLLKANDTIAAKDIEDLLLFEVEFANVTQDETFDFGLNETSQVDDETAGFNRVNISMLQETVPEIKWGDLVGYIFDYIGLEAGKFGPDKLDLNIVVHCEKYLKRLVILLNSTSPRTVANYLTWRFVAKYLPYLDIHFRRLYHDFRREVPNLSDERTYFARWKECVHLVNEGFGMALASLYVKKEFNKELESEIIYLISALKGAFVSSIQQQIWLDSDTKVLCEEKVGAMSSKIGFPKYILDHEQLNADYSGLEISEEHFLDNILKMNRYEVTKELMKMTRTVDKERDWFVQPLVVNAYYEPAGNAVIFPAGILRYPIFTKGSPKYLNYGMLGVVIGHEITHGFDNSGRKFDKVGNMTQWWSDEIIEKFQEHASCFVEQYSQLPIDMVDKNVNGNNTLGDNICDNSGLKQAYRAYSKFVSENGEEPNLPGIPFTNMQIFFLQYAQIWCEVLNKEAYERYVKDSHSPGKYRANVPLMNSPEFADVYQCPPGSPMNPAKKCRLWG